MDPSSQLPEPPVPPSYKDRQTGLIAFGIFEIILGAFCALFIPLMFLAQAMAGRATGSPAQYRVMLPAVGVYGFMAVIMIVLGIGSIRARRWARALSLILGWSWLLMGAIALVVYAIVLPGMIGAAGARGQGMPDSARLVAIIVSMAILAVIFVAVPTLLVVFYQSRHVKATCEARDPVTRWTDACPLPVLALALWLALGGLCMLLMPAAYHSVVPFFGVLLSGIAGALVYLVVAALWVYAAWAIYHLKLSGWWIALVVMVVFGLSNLLTFSRIDMFEMYRRMGYPEAQIEQLNQLQFLRNGGMLWLSVAGFVPLVVYILYVRRFFGRAAS